RQELVVYWPSLEAHAQLCNLKGKTEEDCQNYIRILFYTAPGKFLICGTNSYKPLCKLMQLKNGQVIVEKEMEGIGLCPYDPEHNSTAVYSNGHLFSATVADFSGTDPLIYREPLRTELSDLRQLNESTSDVVEGKYGGDSSTKIIYSALTTPHNAIGASAICVFQMEDIQSVFQGPFKHQESINTNWLPVPESKVPTPRPGECVQDRLFLPCGRPLLIRVSLNYRFTAITVDPQVRTVNDETFDVIYIGTDDGRVLKVVNIPSSDSTKAFVISENEVFTRTSPIKQLKAAPGYGKVSGHNKSVPKKEYDTKSIDTNSLEEDKESTDSLLRQDIELTDCNEVDGDKITGCASQSKLTLYTSEYLHIIVAVASLAGLFVGFLCGYLVSRRFSRPHAVP
ncbi:hypothetical protein NQ318_020661, partial [Aromia moschata]